ncbi:MAG: trigger factor [Lachnospiraceae bacterium]|nr:trigger factor [Lachnospiraceae bacterium]
MSLSVENLEHNMAKLTIEASAETLDAAINEAYKKAKGKISVPGFRKGKVPQAYLEKMYGVEMFYEDAANIIIPDAYAKELEESDLDIVSQPQVEVTQIEKGKPFIFTALVAIKPEVTLGDYKGIEVPKTDVTVTEEEIAEEISKVQDQNSRTITIEDRPVQDKDEVTIDFVGSVDGEEFEGGKGEDYPLVIGSHSFIDNFEDQLIGSNIGDLVDVNVTFPEEYHAKDLAGKPALFKVTIKGIKAKEVSEFDDEFVQEVSEFDTVDEYKADLKAKLEEKKSKEAKTEKENTVIDKIIENATMDIPDAMLQTQVRQMAEEFAQRLSYQGLKLEQYFQFTGLNQDTFLAQMQPQATKRIESRLVLEAIAKAEAIEVSEDELKKEVENMAAAYQMEADKLMEMIGDREKEQMKQDIAVQKAVDLVVEAAKEV